MSGPAPASSPARRVLVLEDDALVGMNLVSYLKELGAEVTWSTNVPDAVSLVDHHDPIDVAIVDFNLDGVMSVPVLDRLIARGVFTILCTGYEPSSVDDRFKDLPRSEKPFTRSKIRALLRDRI